MDLDKIEIDKKIEQIKNEKRFKNKNKISISEYNNLEHRDRVKLVKSVIN